MESQSIGWGKTRNSYVAVSSIWFEQIVKAVKAARKRKGLSQQDLAALLGTTQSEISRFENGRSNPTVELVNRLISLLELQVKVTLKRKRN